MKFKYEEDETVDVSGDSFAKCVQFTRDGKNQIGDEDCLYLNIYVPRNVLETDDDLAPVMFWIYGGALQRGSNNFFEYGPLPYMDQDVIVVAVNYRLGPFGFLSLGTEEVPGNAGLTDQALGLKWVNDNIQSFKGDPQLVTIFGESAGSLSVALQILSPYSRGLFKRAILQSGSALNPGWGTISPEKALEYASTASERYQNDFRTIRVST